MPDIPEKLRARGDEILGHGITNSEEQGHLDEEAEAKLIRTVTETIARHEGQRPIGWMSPWLSNSEVSADLLQEAGYRYFMDWTCDDQPIWMKTRHGRILAMPYPIETNDNRAIVWFRYTASELADMLIDTFDEMLEQSARQPLVYPISLHPFVMGRPYRIHQLRRVFQHILLNREHIWLTRPRVSAPISRSYQRGSCRGAERLESSVDRCLYQTTKKPSLTSHHSMALSLAPQEWIAHGTLGTCGTTIWRSFWIGRSEAVGWCRPFG